MIMPYIPTPAGSDAAGVLVVEVEREAFEAVLKQAEKPLVFEHKAWLQHRYLVRYAGYFFLYRQKNAYVPPSATVLTVTGFHASPASIA